MNSSIILKSDRYQVRPNTDDLEYTYALMDLIFGYSSLDKSTSLWANITLFIGNSNGNLRDWNTATGLKHVCNLSCPCKCATVRDLRLKAALVSKKVILNTRPPVPALTRWLCCNDTAGWFMSFVTCCYVFGSFACVCSLSIGQTRKKHALSMFVLVLPILDFINHRGLASRAHVVSILCCM